MHELSIALELVARLQRLLEEEGARGVHEVRLTVGLLSGVDPDALEGALPLAVADTPLEGARWIVTPVEPEVDCPACGRRSRPEAPFPICAHCGSPEAAIVAGRDLLIESVTLTDE
jgi:hydrogenase nickel incorporation protein HypA/HybF